MIVNITTEDEYKKHIQNAHLAVIEFRGKWCKECKAFERTYERLSKLFPSVSFAVADVDDLRDILTETGLINSVPSFFFYRHGERLAMHSGADERNVIDLLKEHGPLSNTNARIVPLTESLSFAGQLSPLQLKNLSIIGMKSVINLRDKDEEGFIDEEAALVTSAGISYELIPILGAIDIDRAYTDKVIDTIKRLPAPCLVHCKVGMCAAMVCLMKEGKEAGAEVKDVLTWASDLGFDFAGRAAVYQIVKDYMEETGGK